MFCTKINSIFNVLMFCKYLEAFSKYNLEVRNICNRPMFHRYTTTNQKPLWCFTKSQAIARQMLLVLCSCAPTFECTKKQSSTHGYSLFLIVYSQLILLQLFKVCWWILYQVQICQLCHEWCRLDIDPDIAVGKATRKVVSLASVLLNIRKTVLSEIFSRIY